VFITWTSKSVFLNADLKEEVYVHQPSRFAIPGMEGKVLRLRQALRVWNAKLDSTLKGMGFGQSPHEAAIYRWGNGGNALLVGVYVDDLVITGTKHAELAGFKEEMKATFQMSDLGLLSFYLGIEVLCASRPLRYVSVINDNHLVSLMNFNAAKVN
jgi:hypothetical protein